LLPSKQAPGCSCCRGRRPAETPLLLLLVAERRLPAAARRCAVGALLRVVRGEDAWRLRRRLPERAVRTEQACLLRLLLEVVRRLLHAPSCPRCAQQTLLLLLLLLLLLRLRLLRRTGSPKSVGSKQA